MTNVERQILINQVAIMSTLAHIININKDENEQVVNDLLKCTRMTYELINPQSETTDIRNAILNVR